MHTDDITFKVTGRDAEKLNEFQKLHDGCLEGMAGGRFSYSFSPTSLGMAIRKVLPQMPGRSGDELLMGITEILYLHYELDKPLIPQVKENGKLAEKMLMMVKGTLKEYRGWRG